MQKYFVYILQSDRGRHYIGQTSDLERRITEHNTPHNGFTGTTEKWEIQDYIEMPNRHEAMVLEHHLKKLKNWRKALKYLKELKMKK
ncbi:MAG: GIY-YIG nuclease family protein [Bacteroidetes bacterium]|nr:MAG: GIY-YIG nuclease family protein [Bacteroidota bacterium]